MQRPSWFSFSGQFSVRALLPLVSLSIFASDATAYDCSRVAPFQPFEHQSVAITVDRTYWTEEQGHPVEQTERVCETKKPLDIGAYDIRGREDEWYHCFYQEPRPMLECKTQLQGEVASIIVRPAVVLRRWGIDDMRDTHFHVFIFPENDPKQLGDTFVRLLSLDLKNQPVILDGVSGGRGPNTKQNSFAVRVQFR